MTLLAAVQNKRVVILQSLCVQGLKATKDKPNSYLYQALALMATELNYTEEARQWFMEGTKTVMVPLLCLV